MISIIVNVDTRPEKNAQGLMFDGVRTLDFLTEGVRNKIQFFRDYEKEVILVVDVHENVPSDIIHELHRMQSTGFLAAFILRKHSEYFDAYSYFPKFNDLNYLQSLILARGQYVVHFDGDMAAFRKDDCNIVDVWKQCLDEGLYKYISYPSHWSPNAITDPDFDYMWASTRFFITKRENLDYTEILKCLMDSEYLYGKYGDKKRKCPWLEHILGIIAGPNQVFYPPMDPNNYLIFSWSKYHKGTLQKLNAQDYVAAREYVKMCGGINYPCDVRGIQLV